MPVPELDTSVAELRRSMHGHDPAWWTSYFDSDFLRLYRALLPPAEAQLAAASVVELLGLAPSSRILDLACGWGRHAREFAELGIEVVGVDRSETLLRHAAAAAPSEGRPGWVCADIRELPFRPAFDAVVCLFSSLGYFLSDEEDLRALRAARDALTARGTLVLETMHRDGAVREYAERDWWDGEGGEHVWVEREFDALEGVTREAIRWLRPDGTVGEKHHVARIRTATEWNALLCAAGFFPVAWYGGWELEPFSHSSATLIVLAQREDVDSLAHA
jgi:SAM-dependent methyltransferase